MAKVGRPERHPCTCPACGGRYGVPVTVRRRDHYDERDMRCGGCGHRWVQKDYLPFRGDRSVNPETWAG